MHSGFFEQSQLILLEVPAEYFDHSHVTYFFSNTSSNTGFLDEIFIFFEIGLCNVLSALSHKGVLHNTS
jgi:hypothetical protein